jgi:hypothetical protein
MILDFGCNFGADSAQLASLPCLGSSADPGPWYSSMAPLWLLKMPWDLAHTLLDEEQACRQRS